MQSVNHTMRQQKTSNQAKALGTVTEIRLHLHLISKMELRHHMADTVVMDVPRSLPRSSATRLVGFVSEAMIPEVPCIAVVEVLAVV